MSAICFDVVMSGSVERPRGMDRVVRDRLRRLERTIGNDLERLRTEAAASKAAVAKAAGLDRSFYGRIERGGAPASLESITAAAMALGADVSIRIYGGTGPRLVDRHSARMTQAVLSRMSGVWRPHLEVPVWRPVRGVIDGVFERIDAPLMVITEFASTLTRIEQQLRWSAEKADAIGSSRLVGDGPVPQTSRLLVLRSTAANRAIARQFETLMCTAYPAPTAAAVASLIAGAPWPGDSVVWVRIEGDAGELMPGPPRGIRVGR